MGIESICRDILTQHNHIAADVVDLETSNKLASCHQAGYFTDTHIEKLSIAAAQIFYSPSIIRSRRAECRTSGAHHFICKVPGKGAVPVVITPTHANRDSGRDATRVQLEHIAAYCPDAIKA